MNTSITTPAELAALLDRDGKPTLVDVRSNDEFRRRRLPGAVNNCVYEIQFVERMASLVSDFTKPLCVYGQSADTHESRMAAEKLQRAGYREVLDLREGLEGWETAGLEVEEASEPESAPIPELDGVRDLDLSESRIEWIGRNLLNRHRGTLKIKSGSLDFDAGKLAGGRFVFDMDGITCENLQGDPLHDVLVNHLRSHDFFDTEFFPEARFRLLSAAHIPGATPGAPDLKIEGELILKEQIHPVAFEAVTGLTAEGRFGAQATLSFDRTRWNVLYGSGKLFHNLGMHLVNDLIELQIRIVTQ